MTSYAVLGPGGVGGLVAAALSRQGHPVTCIASEQTADALVAGGITVHSSLFGDFTAMVHAAPGLDHPVDACFITTKATTLAGALQRLPRDRIGDTLLIPLLNGLDHVALLQRDYDPACVLPGVIHVESTRVSVGRIEHGSSFARVSLADDAVPPDRLRRVAEDLTAARFEVATGPQQAIMWNKLSFLATAALLTSRYRATMGQVRTQHRAQLEQTAREIAAVSGASGGPGDAEHIIGMFDAFNSDGKTSMLRDLEAGRPMELDAIGGAVLRAAGRHGIPVPTVQALVDALAGTPA